MRTKTKQEQFWAGSFGSEYTDRNAIDPQARRPYFEHVLKKMRNVTSICELGANRGHNLEAIKQTGANFELTGVELNEDAFAKLQQIANVSAVLSSIQDFEPDGQFDLVFVAGVLIHIDPKDLPAIYKKLAALARRYVLISEYFNPTPVEITYRGHDGVLFKRDFAGEFLDANPDFAVLDYAFQWKRLEPAWDNSTWFLLERR